MCSSDLTPTTNGVFTFTVRVRDYHVGAAGVSQNLTLNIAPPPPVRLALSVTAQGANSLAQLLLYGTPGQQQVVQFSSDLVSWAPLTTNLMATNRFQLIETNAGQFPQRFYRVSILP